MVEVPYDLVGHLARIRVGLPDGSHARFLVDTGVGLSIVSPSLVQRHGLASTGRSHTGHRMSGQAVVVPLVDLPALDLRADGPSAGAGGFAVVSGLGGVADLGPADGANGFDGILGLDLLGDLGLTIDPFRSKIRLGLPDPASDTPQIDVPVRVRRDGPAVELRADLRLPDDSVIEVEVDTGSAATILAERFMAACGADGNESNARIDEGTDQTGHNYVRRFIPIEAALSLAAAPQTEFRRPTVMFQDIALDGLIGTDFLNRYVQTYDTTRCRMILAAPNRP